MKGSIFRSFLHSVEEQHGSAFLDRLLTEAEPASGGAYTAVGDYPFDELLVLAQRYGEMTGEGIAAVVKLIGKLAFEDLAPAATGDQDLLGQLLSLDRTMTDRVRRLHPDSDIPRIMAKDGRQGRLRLDVHGLRRQADFMEGLLQRFIDSHASGARLVRHDLGARDGRDARFHVIIPA